MSMVAELVRQYHFDLVVRIVRQERIREEDPSAVPSADERGVCAPRLVAESPFVDAKYGHAGPA